MDRHVNFTLSDRLRKSPYYEATLKAGAKTFTLYNHMIMPTSYEGAEADYWNLMNNVTMWDVAAERQVEIIGGDAISLLNILLLEISQNSKLVKENMPLLLMKMVEL